jgi:hypothetical protein
MYQKEYTMSNQITFVPVVKDWDLNIYFLEEWDEETETSSYPDTLRINPVLWSPEDVTYSNWYIDTTFAETRYPRSQYPEHEYGMDWTDSLTSFLKIAPPRIKQVLLSLPSAETVDAKDVLELVG